MRLALLFPGQAMASPAELARALAVDALDEDSAPLVARAARAAGRAREEIVADGGRLLERTEVLQPLLVALCLGRAAPILRAARPVAFAGHSLGELTAWAAAGAISVEDAIDVAALRGRLMAREAARRPGGLLAVTAERSTLPSLLAAGGAPGAVELAAVNAPDELVLAGAPGALARVAARFPSRLLPALGAWHGAAMADGVAALAAALAPLPRRAPSAPVLANRDGAVADAAVLPTLLAEQLVRPVEWSATLATLRSLGADTLVTVGPGRVLRGLVRRSAGDPVAVLTTEDGGDAARTLARIAVPR